MIRHRQYRTDAETRNKHAEVHLSADDFIYPYFVMGGNHGSEEIKTLEGIKRYSVDALLEDIHDCSRLGLRNILLFGVIDEKLKDATGSAAWREDNLISTAVRKIKNRYPEMTVFTDVCLCGYTNHGHCGLLQKNDVDNDSTLPYLGKMALEHARAGADFVAPSAMMDGQVKEIRKQLRRNKQKARILSYSAKYASCFYGPFRDAAKSSPSSGDRKTYQMDYHTIKQALSEVKADIDEGADWVMVKPAHTYLDIIARIKKGFPRKTLAAYQVSGEYMMIKSAARAGLLDETTAMLEVLTAIKRAGANKIISYYAKDFIRKGL